MITKFHETNLTGPRTTRPTQEYSRLLTAAVISPNFRKVLLNNPGKALTSGYCGETFSLPQEQKKRVSSIRAESLPEFAAKLTAYETARAAYPIAGD